MFGSDQMKEWWFNPCFCQHVLKCAWARLTPSCLVECVWRWILKKQQLPFKNIFLFCLNLTLDKNYHHFKWIFQLLFFPALQVSKEKSTNLHFLPDKQYLDKIQCLLAGLPFIKTPCQHSCREVRRRWASLGWDKCSKGNQMVNRVWKALIS